MKIAVITSGGDAPGMNACVRAIVRYGLSKNHAICAFRRGYQGILEDDYLELGRTSVSDMIQRGGTFLQTDRSDEFATPGGRQKAADILRSHQVDALIVIGGDGSLTGARCLYEETGMPVIGLPGTIDNDLAYTDYTLGFDTAVNTVLNAINNLRDTMQSHNKVTFVEVMGRRCGDIALNAGISGGAEYVLVPEVRYDIRDIADKIKGSAASGKKSNLVVVAEGAGNMEALCEEFERYSGIKPRQTRLGFIQRGGSPTYQDRLFACRLGIRAVELLEEGKTHRAVGIKEGALYDIDLAEALSLQNKFDQDLYDNLQYLI